MILIATKTQSLINRERLAQLALDLNLFFKERGITHNEEIRLICQHLISSGEKAEMTAILTFTGDLPGFSKFVKKIIKEREEE